jgi:hypothetical protein
METPGTRILNAVDPHTPTVFERGVAIATHMGADCEFVRLATAAGDDEFGRKLVARKGSIPADIGLDVQQPIFAAESKISVSSAAETRP